MLLLSAARQAPVFAQQHAVPEYTFSKQCHCHPQLPWQSYFISCPTCKSRIQLGLFPHTPGLRFQVRSVHQKGMAKILGYGLAPCNIQIPQSGQQLVAGDVRGLQSCKWKRSNSQPTKVMGKPHRGPKPIHLFSLPAICSCRDSQQNYLFQIFLPGTITYFSCHRTVSVLHEGPCWVKFLHLHILVNFYRQICKT